MNIEKIDPKQILVIDTETTGLSNRDEVLQIAMIDGSGTVLIDRLIKPSRRRKWPEAQLIHGISPAAVAQCQTMRHSRKLITSLLTNAALIVGYNIGFDIRMLLQSRIKMPLEDKYIDLMEPFAEVFGERPAWLDGEYKWQKLSTCAAYYGYKPEPGRGWHDACSDAFATLHCFKRMVKDGVITEPNLCSYKF